MKTAFLALLVALTAINAQAQQTPSRQFVPQDCIDGHRVGQNETCPAITAGASLDFLGRVSGTEPVIGSVNRDPLAVRQGSIVPLRFFGGYMPERRLGFRLSFNTFRSEGTMGPSAQADSVIQMWGNKDVKPIVVSSNPVAYSPVSFVASSGWKFRELRPEVTWGIQSRGLQTWITFGPEFLWTENIHAEGQERSVLLYNQLPNKQQDPVSNLKQFTFDVNGSNKYSGKGLAFGVEVETCPLWGALYIEGKANYAFSKGTLIGAGRAKMHETISLVPTSQGLNGTGPASAAPIDTMTPFAVSQNASVSVTRLQAAVGVRRGSMRLLGGIAFSRYGNVPQAPSWTVGPTQSFEFGRQLALAPVTITSISPTVTLAVRF